jgi:hypothetical protein
MGLLGAGLLAAGTAFSIPPAIEAIDRLTGDLWDADWLGRKGRQAKMRAAEAVSMMLDNNQMEHQLWKEQALGGALAPFEGVTGLEGLPGFDRAEEQRGLMSILQREQQHLGRIAETSQGPDFEALALRLGY